MRSVLVPDIGHPPGGEPDRKNPTVHETEVAAVCLSDDSRRADFLELIENQEWVARIFGERFNQGMHRLQRFFAGKNRTFFKTVDVVPGKLPRLVEQQGKLFTICDSTHGRLKLASLPALTHVRPPISTCRFAHLCRTSPAAPFARRHPRDFTFYLGNLFLRLFVCHNIVKNRLSYGQRPIRPRARVAQSLCHRHRASHHPRDARSRRVVCRSSHSLHCISAAPAALDRYLAALPAMSLIPFAPFKRRGRPSSTTLRRGKQSPAFPRAASRPCR